IEEVVRVDVEEEVVGRQDGCMGVCLHKVGVFFVIEEVVRVDVEEEVVGMFILRVGKGFSEVETPLFEDNQFLEWKLIYVSCIKQFWTIVVVKQVNDVTRLQALVDKKKVVVTEATIRKALCLDDVEGVDFLPNEEIFAELVGMGYEKPSTKLTFYKAFFSSQWK
nr:hypothetical protein [Tanacetum cinerariifolium]